MIDDATMKKWIEWSRRDDAWTLFVPSDIRVMLGEIEQLRYLLQQACTRIRGMPCLDANGEDQFIPTLKLVEQIEAALASSQRDEA